MPHAVKKIAKPLVFAVVILIAAASVRAQTKIQTVFDLEGKVTKKAALPAAVLAILKSDERVDQCFRENGAGAGESKWFAASRFDLNRDGRMDLIVKAEDACLFGANQGPFWIFQNLPGGYQKILTAYGLQLAVLPQKTDAFNRIEVSRVVAMRPASEIYSFREGEYRTGKAGKRRSRARRD